MIAIVNAGTNDTFIEKRKYDNDDYEWDALEMALIYALRTSHKDEVWFFGDNNQVIRWMQKKKPTCGNSIIKQKCLEKMIELRKTATIVPQWVPREQNWAGRVLQHHTKRSNKPTQFTARWHSCRKCTFVSLIEKELSEHYYNEHVTNG